MSFNLLPFILVSALSANVGIRGQAGSVASEGYSSNDVCVQDYKAGCQAYGFEYNPDWTPFKTAGFMCRKTVQEDKNGLQYVTEVQDILLRCNASWNVYCYMYRVAQTAYQPGRNNGFMGIGSYGDNWYARGVQTVIDLKTEYNITDFAPKNDPKEGAFDLSVGFDGSKLSVSASVSIVYSELQVISRTKTPTCHYETEYVVSGYGDYAKNTIYHYGLMVFATPTTPYEEPSVSSHHFAKYEGREYHGNVTQTIHAGR